MAELMDGTKLAEDIKTSIKVEVEALKKTGLNVGLAVMLIGNNPASKQYYYATLKACKNVGIIPHEFRFSDEISVNEILNTINFINSDEKIHGLLILFPIPRRMDARRIVNALSPEKDVDGLGAISIGRLSAEESIFQVTDRSKISTGTQEGHPTIPTFSGFLPCTPFGVMRLLEHHNVKMNGRHAVVIGKSLAVGKPLALMLLYKEATVTVCHKETHDLAYFTKQADIVCSATGRTNLITADIIKEGAVVVDIGINVLADGRIVGDVDFDSVSKKASMITPVPGGVGPVTIAILLENTLRSAQRKEFLKSPSILTL